MGVAVGDQLDLHGMTAAEACASAGRFIESSGTAGTARKHRARPWPALGREGIGSEGSRPAVPQVSPGGTRLRQRTAVRWWSWRRLPVVAHVIFQQNGLTGYADALMIPPSAGSGVSVVIFRRAIARE